MRNARRKKPRAWSYVTGERGKNRVRAYDRGVRGIYLDFAEPDPTAPGGRRRVRMALGHVDREMAKAKADEVALAFRRQEREARSADLTLSRLFELYEREVTPTKGIHEQRHDRRCFEMFRRFFGADRKVKTLSRLDWDRFIGARRTGSVAPRKAKRGQCVRERPIQHDCRLLLAVPNWATVAGDGRGGTLLDRNPLRGLPVPREESPKRPMLTDDQYAAVRKAAAEMSTLIELLVVLVHETGHRAASVRQLRWADVDLERKTVRWRGESDKIGMEHVTPLTDEAVTLLLRERTRATAIGDSWIFPAARDPRRCRSGDAVFNIWKRLADRAGLPSGERYGWHSLRRKFASEMKHTPLRDLAHLGGWKSTQTIVTCYQQPDEATQREALAQRRPLRVSGG